LELISDAEEDGIWDCEQCVIKGWLHKRNCNHPYYSFLTEEEIEDYKESKKATTKYSLFEGKKRKNEDNNIKKFLLPNGNKIDYCPLSDLDIRIVELVKLIYWSEEIGIMPFQPNALMEQSNVYVQARWAVIGERSKIQFLKSKKEQDRAKAEQEKNRKEKRK
jgi:hypothetical protein